MQTNWQRIMAITLILLACAPMDFAQSAKQTQLSETVSKSWAQLLASSQDYRASLARVLELQMQEQARAGELLEKQKLLFAQGSISKRELEAGEHALQAAHKRSTPATGRSRSIDCRSECN